MEQHAALRNVLPVTILDSVVELTEIDSVCMKSASVVFVRMSYIFYA